MKLTVTFINNVAVFYHIKWLNVLKQFVFINITTDIVSLSEYKDLQKINAGPKTSNFN